LTPAGAASGSANLLQHESTCVGSERRTAARVESGCSFYQSEHATLHRVLAISGFNLKSANGRSGERAVVLDFDRQRVDGRHVIPMQHRHNLQVSG